MPARAAKRIKLESSPTPPPDEAVQSQVADQVVPEADMDEDESEHCSICLQAFEDRTVLPVCAHGECRQISLLGAISNSVLQNSASSVF